MSRLPNSFSRDSRDNAELIFPFPRIVYECPVLAFEHTLPDVLGGESVHVQAQLVREQFRDEGKTNAQHHGRLTQARKDFDVSVSGWRSTRTENRPNSKLWISPSLKV